MLLYLVVNDIMMLLHGAFQKRQRKWLSWLIVKTVLRTITNLFVSLCSAKLTMKAWERFYHVNSMVVSQC